MYIYHLSFWMLVPDPFHLTYAPLQLQRSEARCTIVRVLILAAVTHVHVYPIHSYPIHQLDELLRVIPHGHV